MIGELPQGVTRPRVGDEVLIRGTVKEYLPGVGVLVELLSKTDQYEAWVRLDHIAQVIPPNPPAEPADGTWLAGVETDDLVGYQMFVRDDTKSEHEPERRFQRHWFDVAAQQWVDWPTAVKRGADPSRPLGVSR